LPLISLPANDVFVMREDYEELARLRRECIIRELEVLALQAAIVVLDLRYPVKAVLGEGFHYRWGGH
jgi:hypothetical protein